MAFLLDRHNRLSYAAQVQRQALAQLVAGRLHPGDRLPSVRQLARDLGISRTTAERIQDVLCETTFAEVRPRSGAFVAAPDDARKTMRTLDVQGLYDFLKHTIGEARQFGLGPERLAQLIQSFDENARSAQRRVASCFPIIATRDAYECMVACFDAGFPAQLIHLRPTALPTQFPAGARYVLSGYYLRGRARKIADAVKRPLLYVRYNVNLLDRAMAIPRGDFRYFVTRDADNAETTRGFLASAYPEIAATQYAVMAAAQFLEVAAHSVWRGTLWPTVTALPLLKEVMADRRTELFHPILADDFIEELRCLALLG